MALVEDMAKDFKQTRASSATPVHWRRCRELVGLVLISCIGSAQEGCDVLLCWDMDRTKRAGGPLSMYPYRCREEKYKYHRGSKVLV